MTLASVQIQLRCSVCGKKIDWTTETAADGSTSLTADLKPHAKCVAEMIVRATVEGKP